MKIIRKHFPDLSAQQLSLLEQLPAIYTEKNQKVNLISRADIENICPKHIFHSLSIAKFIAFKPGTRILDLGTGGGFPGIPLAIYFPECQFILVDSIGKKIKIVNEIIDELKLENVNTINARAESLKIQVDFVVCRAVAKLDKLISWSHKLIHQKQINPIPNGIIALKGGNIQQELKEARVNDISEVRSLNKLFNIEFFDEKYIIYIPA